MRASAALFALVACAAAAPRAQEDGLVVESSTSAPAIPSTSLAIPDPTVSLPVSTSLNVPVTSESSLPTSFSSFFGSSSSSTSKKRGHSEPIPIFSKFCDCPNLATMAYPCYATDSLQRCNFEENHSLVCWTSAARGCPYPTRTCANLFSPTPVTGRHPCELGPPADATDTSLPANTSVPVISSLPVLNSTAVVLPTLSSATIGTQ